MKIRAVTLFLGEELPELPRFPKEVDRASREVGVEVWTKRAAFPPCSPDEFSKRAKALEGILDLVAIPIEPRGATQAVAEALGRVQGIFTSIAGGEPELEAFLELLEEVFSRFGPGACTRLCFTPGEPLVTPYFPAASARHGQVGVAASLLYAQDLQEAWRRGGSFEQVIRDAEGKARGVLERVAEALGVENLGVDLSISPWMEESVAKLVEAVSGGTFGGPGSYSSVRKLNQAIASAGVKGVGFNEVMLSYAEDLRLRELGAKGELTAYGLLSFAPLCVAGLDMVVVPRGEGFKEFIEDAFAVLSSKGRPAGLRVIPVQAKAGSGVKLERFGELAVLRLR